MLLIRARTSPCRARIAPSSLSRVTATWVLSTFTVTPSGTARLSSPLGPFTATVPSFSVTVTPDGTVTGFFPIRDMGSPHLADDLAAHALLARFAVGHHALRGRDDRRAQ